MQDLLFEYAVIRVTPRVERDEFVNVGVILYCGVKKYLGMQYKLDKELLLHMCPTTDTDAVQDALRSIQMVVDGGKSGGPIGLLGVAERFRWLAAVRSTMVQTSRVHSGICINPAETLAKIFSEQVNR